MERKISTKKTWKDVTLKSDTRKQLEDVIKWLNQNELSKKVITGSNTNPSKLLFCGSLKTIKKTTAALLAKQAGQDVYRIDVSEIVSKYAGETEKNLAQLFSKAENKNWILFFDEADALFGKRTDVNDSHDRYSNQEIDSLQTSILKYPGLIIFSSKTKPDREAKLLIHIQSVIHF